MASTLPTSFPSSAQIRPCWGAKTSQRPAGKPPWAVGLSGDKGAAHGLLGVYPQECHHGSVLLRADQRCRAAAPATQRPDPPYDPHDQALRRALAAGVGAAVCEPGRRHTARALHQSAGDRQVPAGGGYRCKQRLLIPLRAGFEPAPGSRLGPSLDTSSKAPTFFSGPAPPSIPSALGEGRERHGLYPISQRIAHPARIEDNHENRTGRIRFSW